MRWRAVQGGWLVVLEQGDDVLESLRRAAREAGVRSAALSGLGAANGVQLAYWDAVRREYLRADFEGDHEFGALVGNVTQLDGQPFVHAHAVIGGPDFHAYTGHLMAARCGATLEIYLHDFGGAVHRGMVPDIGLNLCKL
jgi:predicted DNA-binding protein with PD1-like motif